MPFPSHADAAPLPCRAAKGLDSFPFDLHSAAVFDSHMPCRTRAMPWPCRSESDFSRPRQSAAWAWHGTCELGFILTLACSDSYRVLLRSIFCPYCVTLSKKLFKITFKYYTTSLWVYKLKIKLRTEKDERTMCFMLRNQMSGWTSDLCRKNLGHDACFTFYRVVLPGNNVSGNLEAWDGNVN
jgi:hypothetical protein